MSSKLNAITDEQTARNTSSRREFLNLAVLSAGSLLAVGLVRASLKAAQPRIAANEYGGVFNLGSIDGVPASGEAPVNYPAGRFYLAHTDEGVLALHKVCPHLDCLVGWDEQSGNFVCPCHGSQFAADGAVLSGPADRPLDRFVVTLATPDGQVVAESQIGSAAQPLALPSPTENPADTDEDAEPAGQSDQEANLVLLVDTGRKVRGETAVQS